MTFRSSRSYTLHKAWNKARAASGYRSQFEAEVAKHFGNSVAVYEATSIPYSVSAIHRYTPDWWLPDQCICIEAKGRFTIEDRNKMLLVKNQYPDLDIRMVFQRLSQKVTKTVTVQDWCDAHGFPCCKGPEIPKEWLKHKPSAKSKAAFSKFWKDEMRESHE